MCFVFVGESRWKVESERMRPEKTGTGLSPIGDVTADPCLTYATRQFGCRCIHLDLLAIHDKFGSRED